jgi:uncharacterized protein YqjF (DUF2071 family)
MNAPASPLLTAQWRHLAMLNYEVDPAALAPFTPAGTELDEWNGRTYVSMVGFLFLDARLFGRAVPCHKCFEEVNLRFYVRRKAENGWRRAVVFVKELVSRVAVAWTARTLYGENYAVVPMRHEIKFDSSPTWPRSVTYAWRFRGRDHRLKVETDGATQFVEPGSHAEFITEHYWGYTRRSRGRTTEFRVAHPQWRVCPAVAAQFDCDVLGIYGSRFVECLSAPPATAFLVDGSEITVYRAVRLPAHVAKRISVP